MSEEDGEYSFDSLAERLEKQLEGKEEQLNATGRIEELREDYLTILKDVSSAIVLFHQQNCPFCKQLIPTLEEIAMEYKGKVFFGSIEIDLIDGVIDEHEIRGVSLTIAFKKGYEADRIEGLQTSSIYEKWVAGIQKGVKLM